MHTSATRGHCTPSVLWRTKGGRDRAGPSLRGSAQIIKPQPEHRMKLQLAKCSNYIENTCFLKKEKKSYFFVGLPKMTLEGLNPIS